MLFYKKIIFLLFLFYFIVKALYCAFLNGALQVGIITINFIS